MFTVDIKHIPPPSIVAIDSPAGLKSKLVISLAKCKVVSEYKNVIKGCLAAKRNQLLCCECHFDSRLSFIISPVFEALGSTLNRW